MRGARLFAGTALCVFLVVMVPAHTAAQRHIKFAHLTTKAGLSQSAVNCIFQDRQGFMWFGTQDGLNRFDGYTFTTFKNSPADSTSINDNFIYSILEDGNGDLWITTLNRPEMLNKFNRATESFSHRPADSVDLSDARVSSVITQYRDGAGVEWIGSVGGGVTRLDTKSNQKTLFKHDPSKPGSLSSNRVYSVYGDRSGTVWVGTLEGLDRYDPVNNTFIHYRHNSKDPYSLSDNWVWPIYEDRSGTLWIGTVRGGLNKFDRNSGRFMRYKHNKSNPQSIGDDYVLSIYQDRSGLLWVGTNNNGLSYFHPELAPFEHFAKDPADPRSLIDNNVTSIYVDRSGTPWIGTQGGLDRFDPATGSFTHYTHSPSNPKSLAEDVVLSMVDDRSGTLWFGTQSSGLDRFDPRTGSFTHFKSSPGDPQSLSDNRIYGLCEDGNGHLWIGTYGSGINRFDPGTGVFTRFVHNDSLPNSLSSNAAWTVLEDRSGVIWVGTYGGGLNRFDGTTGTFTVYMNREGDSTSLGDDNVLSLYDDKAGTLWVGTAGGLNKFDRSTNTFRRYRVKDGLPNDNIYGILEDGRGHLWMSTNKGIARFDPRTERFRNYDVSDGLQGDEFNQNASGMNPATGEMYFGGPNGVTMFHPDSVRDNVFIPPVVFSAFRRYNTDDEEGRPIEETGIAARRQVHLTYKDNIATFDFATLSFLNAGKNQYAYKLEGFSESWIQLGNERRATFTNLDAGEYVLRVKGSNSDGVWNDAGASLDILVTPPWWKTTWAYSGYGIIFLGVLFGLRRVEINRREQKAQIRESQLRAKAAEAEKRVLEIENERKTKELDEARTLQLSMLPQELPKLSHLEIGVFMKTATEVGGDYYDFQLVPDGTLNVAFGDATGHGMQAGTIVTLMKGMFTSDASRLGIQEFFNHCSRSIKGIKLGRLLMAFSLLKISRDRVSFSSAGMPPVFIHRKNTNLVDEIMIKGMPLGAMKNFPYVVREELLQPGDTLLLLSDGLPEQKNAAGEMFDYVRVQNVFRDAAGSDPDGIIKQLVAAADSWMQGAVQEDDITVMVIRMKG
ncbi:MAG: two-component regulator propeller domain-containing protein [Bacteroidota bacterium]